MFLLTLNNLSEGREMLAVSDIHWLDHTLPLVTRLPEDGTKVTHRALF